LALQVLGALEDFADLGWALQQQQRWWQQQQKEKQKQKQKQT
jgi:hypothetical protein